MSIEHNVGELRLDRVLQVRGALEDAIPSLSYSTGDGRFEYHASLGAIYLPPGCYVTLNVGSAQYLGQIISQRIALRDVGVSLTSSELGSKKAADEHEIQLGGNIRIRALEGNGIVLGLLGETWSDAAPDNLVFRDAPFELASPENVASYMLSERDQRTVLEVGTVLNSADDVPALLDPSGFNRHTFLCGQSGSGKTYSLGVILERLLVETTLPVLILDPNSDFVRLPVLKDATAGSVLSERYGTAAAKVQVLRSRRTQATDVLDVQFSELEPSVQAAILMLNPLADREEYDVLMQAVERIGQECYSLSDICDTLEQDDAAGAKALALRIRNLQIASWDVWSRSDEPDFADSSFAENQRCRVMDIGGFAQPEEKLAVANAALAALWRHRYRREPVMIVIDEAHNICPASPSNALAALTNDLVKLIAGEGRKFGLYLLLASQRPDKINADVLSQCENLVLMRMNSESDLGQIQTLFSHVPRTLLAQASHFKLGQALVAGRIVRHPTLLKFGKRFSEEGGGDVPSSWAMPDVPSSTVG